MESVETIVLLLSTLLLIRITNVQSVACVDSDTLYYCVSLSGIELDTDDACVEEDQLCDGTRDCAFGDDEWNCNDENSEDCTEANGYYECTLSPRNDYLATTDTTNVCIRDEYACNNEFDTWDCPRQEDLDPDICDSIRSPCLNATDPLFSIYYTCSDNDVCIYTFWICDGNKDCLNGEDENNSTCTPTAAPFITPSNAPVASPSNVPSSNPSNAPSYSPVASPSNAPSSNPSNVPSYSPSNAPSNIPSSVPSYSPSNAPSNAPAIPPSNAPSDSPSNAPSNVPSSIPSSVPTGSPVVGGQPTTGEPTRPSCWWTNYRGGGGRDGDDDCEPTPEPTSQNPTPKPTDPYARPTSEPSRPSDWWTNYRGGDSGRA